MHRRPLLSLLARHATIFPQDAGRAAAIQRFVETHADCFERSCREGHITGSSWVVSRDGGHALLVRHRKLGAWLQPGGHADGDADAAAVALREAEEESGLSSLAFVRWWRGAHAEPLPFDLDVHPIPAHRGDPAHLHFDVRFLLSADPAEPLRPTAESDEVRWVARDRIGELSSEPGLLRMARRAVSLLARAAGSTLPDRGSSGTLPKARASGTERRMSQETSNGLAALGSFASELAQSLHARSRELAEEWFAAVVRELGGEAELGEELERRVRLVQATAGTLADAPDPDAGARLERELRRWVPLRREKGCDVLAVVRELGLLQEILLAASLDHSATRPEPLPAALAAAPGTRLARAHASLVESALRLFEQGGSASHEARAALLGTLTRKITHELRNRVNAARLTLAAHVAAAERDPELLDNLDESLAQLENAVADVYVAALAQARRFEAGRRPMAKLLGELKVDLDELALARGVTVRIPQPLPAVQVEAVPFQIALLSLVSRAIQRSDKRASNRWVEIAVSPGEPGMWHVVVRDNGTATAQVAASHEAGAGGVPTADLPRTAAILTAVQAAEMLGGRVWGEEGAAGTPNAVCFSLRESRSDS